MTERPQILCITIMRNEGPFLLEWVAHHRALGVTEFLVYSNDCDDGTDVLLDRLAASGRLCHVRQEAKGKSVQWQALRSAKDSAAYASADWVLCIDCDEFVVLKPPFETLRDLVAPQVDAIALPWRLFGAGGHLTYEDQPVTERFSRAAPEVMHFPAAARFFKTLYRREAFQRPGIHRPKPKRTKPARWCDGALDPLSRAFAADEDLIMSRTPEVAYGAVQLNHYSLKSAEDFLVKRRRGLPNRKSKPLDASYWAERNFNQVEDLSAARHAEARREEVEMLRALPGVAEAQQAAVTQHRVQIADLMKDPEAVRLYTRLALLSGSTPPDAPTSARLLRLIQGVG